MRSLKIDYSASRKADVSCRKVFFIAVLLPVIAACGKSGDGTYQPELVEKSMQQTEEYVVGFIPCIIHSA